MEFPTFTEICLAAIASNCCLAMWFVSALAAISDISGFSLKNDIMSRAFTHSRCRTHLFIFNKNKA